MAAWLALFAIFFSSAVVTHSHLLAQDENATTGKTALDLLDEATDLKLSLAQKSYSFRDLERVVTLCEAALESGLEEGNEQYAKQILSGTLYEQAQMVIGPVLGGRIDESWRRRRSMALEAIRKAVHYAPDDGEAHLLLARIHGLPGGDAAEGLVSGNLAVKLLEQNPARKAVALLARAVFQESPEARLADYDAAVEIGEGNLDAYRERGRAKLVTGDVAAAVKDFRHVLDQDDGDLVTIELLTQALIAQGNHEEAIAQATRLVEADPESADALMLRASLYVSQDKFEQAIQDLNACLRRHPRNAEALLGRAAVRQVTEEYEEAIADVDRVLDLNPGLPQALLLRSQIAASAGDLSQSVRDLRQLIRRQPENVSLRMQLAVTLLGDNKPQRAIDEYNALLEIDDEYWPAVRGRGDAYLGVGRHAEAVSDYRSAFEREGMREDSGLLNNFAWVLATSPDGDVRDGERALELAIAACEVTDYSQSHILSTLAAAHAELGDFEKAIEWSTKAIELEKDGSDELREQLMGELKSYQNKEPWRELQEAPIEAAGVADDDLFVEEQDASEPSEPSESAQLESATPDGP